MCFKLPHATINSIGYGFPLEKYKVAYLSEHTWYTAFRRQSVWVQWGLPSPLDLYQKELGGILRKTQTGGTHRTTCAQTVPHWDKGQPEKGQKGRGSGGVVKASVCRALLRRTQDSKEGGPHPNPPPTACAGRAPALA